MDAKERERLTQLGVHLFENPQRLLREVGAAALAAAS